MPSACGLACEVCGFGDKGICPINRCVPGTDPAAHEKLERFTAAMGHPCAILQCVIDKGVDHCTRCPEFPCNVHYEQEIYSHKLLDMIKGMLGRS